MKTFATRLYDDKFCRRKTLIPIRMMNGFHEKVLIKKSEFNSFVYVFSFNYSTFFRPMYLWHKGHVCTASWHDVIQKGMRQQPRKPPNRNISSAISHVAVPTSYRTKVTTCRWHDGHTTVWGPEPKNVTAGWIIVAGWM